MPQRAIAPIVFSAPRRTSFASFAVPARRSNSEMSAPAAKALSARAAYHDAAQRLVGVERTHRVAQAFPRTEAERVELVRVAQRDGGDIRLRGREGISPDIIFSLCPVSRRSAAHAGERAPISGQKSSTSASVVIEPTRLFGPEHAHVPPRADHPTGEKSPRRGCRAPARA